MRGASSSKASNMGISTNDILTAADWSSESVFFYFITNQHRIHHLAEQCLDHMKARNCLHRNNREDLGWYHNCVLNNNCLPYQFLLEPPLFKRYSPFIVLIIELQTTPLICETEPSEI